MQRTLYTSIEEMTRPATLSTLVGRPITTTRLVPFQPIGSSSTDSAFLAVETDDAAHGRYVVKRLERERDWVMQATKDDQWRAIAIWQCGLLDRLPDTIDTTIIACAADGTGYAIMMHDISDAVLCDGMTLSLTDTSLILDAMAALHAAYWDDVTLSTPELGLCRSEELFTHTAPDKIRRIATAAPSGICTVILEGWRLLPTLVDTDVAEVVRTLVHDPQPLCAALARYPQTLVHGDWRLDNLGIRRGEYPQLILLDWARPTSTVSTVDLAYFLAGSAYSHAISPEAVIDLYRERLAYRLGTHVDDAWWQPQLALSLLAVFLIIGPIRAYLAVHRDDAERRKHDQGVLVWWSEQVRAAAKWLD